MTALAGRNYPPAARFGDTGSSVSGIIADFNDLQVTDFASKEPKFWKNGDPVMQTRVSLIQPDGSQVSLYVKPGRMMGAVRDALKEADKADIEEGAKLTVTFTGTEQGKGAQPAKTYTAAYEPDDDEPPF
jgi:hypothetical protein